MMTHARVAFFGLGTMGSGMARRLLSSGFPLSVFNRDRAKTKPFAEAGASVGSSVKEAAAGAHILISMVADDRASRDIWLGQDGALAAAAPGSLLIESSTLTVGWVRELASAAAGHGMDFLDAPVTGSKPHAFSGELRFLVGGSGQALERARPLLSVLGQEIVHLGPSGSGALMKLVNNFLAAVHAVSFAEALSLIKAGGLDPDKAV
ncbi:MAG: NAD(P)-dependent oxidoreductase, partial [Acidobacteria bacterium]|nr:NAD(P)-dependent oxidoreductase [Acidobacteriota bacterium]